MIIISNIEMKHHVKYHNLCINTVKHYVKYSYPLLLALSHALSLNCH